MDGQTDSPPYDLSPIKSFQVQPNPEESSSKSVPTLRFPRPQGSLQVANWVSSSSPDIMASADYTDDDSGLSESSFEFIPRDTDESSQDDRADSLSEALYEYPDEAQAFGGMDDASNGMASSMATDSEPEDAEEEESPSAVYLPATVNVVAEDILRSSFTQSSVLRPIEFREPEDIDIHIDKISVKHTIKEFTEDEAVFVIETLDLDDGLAVDQVPSRLSAMIRQTMSQHCLSNHEAFRVLYVGDEAVKGEIILKISRAITCSSAIDYNEDKTLRKNTEGVYNIIPVTFGPTSDHDIELMEASEFQIKVDTCLDAEEIPIQGGYFSEDIVYSLTVDMGKGGSKYKYKSVPAGGPEGFRVQPSWTLPHIAVIFCSEDDDEHTQEVQEATRAFCKRHAVPTLYISDHPAFQSPVAKRWLDRTHEHAIHLSLQSRELKTEYRFPIDLESFLHIDNRQMNQNLAYLTGLQETPSATDELPTSPVPNKVFDVPGINGLGNRLEKRLQNYTRLSSDQLYSAMRQWLFLVIASLLALHLTMGFSSFLNKHLSGVQVSDVPVLSPTTPSAATATVTVSHTSTKTVRIATAETPSFGGLLSDIAHTVSSEMPKSTVCSVEIYSSTEILIKIPTGTKESWLARGAIDIDVFRGGNLIHSRLSTIDEGILIQIPFKESHGILNVSIITSRKPKINETIAIDFGIPPLYKVLDAAKTALHGAVQMVGSAADNCIDIMLATDEELTEKATSWWTAIQGASKTAQSYSGQIAQDSYNKLIEAMHVDRHGLLQDAQQKVQNQLHRAEDVREDAEMALLKAQITSKLWWLKVQGKIDEYEDYERRARNFMLNKHAQIVKGRKARESTRCPRTGASNCNCKDQTSVQGRWKI